MVCEIEHAVLAPTMKVTIEKSQLQPFLGASVPGGKSAMTKPSLLTLRMSRQAGGPA